MLVVISVFIFLATALVLLILRINQPGARYVWLVATGGAMLTVVSVFLWLAQMPITIVMPTWQPETVFFNLIGFRADGITWPYALSISVLTLAILLTAVSRTTFSNSFTWAGALALGGLGLLAVTAENLLTLLLVWSALDLTELVIQLRFVEGPANNEKVVISFATRMLGIGFLLWANIVNIISGGVSDFSSLSPQAGLYLVVAAGLRLGVLPLHLPYPSETALRRGFGTSLRLVSAAASLVLLSHIPVESLNSVVTPFLMILAVIAALYGGWMWLRAPDELNGRPYWIIGIASLSVIAALSNNPLGAIAWGCALILAGGALFLVSVQQVWLNRALLICAFSLSSLPLSLTAGAWLSGLGFYVAFVIIAQGLLIAGFVRHALRSGGRDSLDTQPIWIRTVYPVGIGILIVAQILLGLIGWNGAFQIGAWLQALLVSILTLVLVWATPRLRILNPVRAHWVGADALQISNLYGFLGMIYRALEWISQIIVSILEGDGGIMWTLLFLILFISLMVQAKP